MIHLAGIAGTGGSVDPYFFSLTYNIEDQSTVTVDLVKCCKGANIDVCAVKRRWNFQQEKEISVWSSNVLSH